MHQPRRSTIRGTLVLFLSIALGLVFAASGFLVVSGVFAQSKRDARLYTESLSREYANRLDGMLEIPLDSSRALAKAMAAFGSIPARSRRRFGIDMLRSVIEAEASYAAVWTMWEPDALDGDDGAHRGDGALGSDSEGRFTAYFYRNGEDIAFEATDWLEESEEPYYAIPRETLKEFLTEPYEYEVQGKSVMMVSTVAPVIIDGRFAGVVGIDITLDDIDSKLGRLSLYRTGFGRLISNQGIVVSHPESALIGKPAPEWSKAGQEGILEALESGKSFSRVEFSELLKRKVLKSFVPIFVGSSPDPWMYGTVVPEEETLEGVSRVLAANILIISIGFLLVVALVWLLTGLLLKPLATTRNALEEIARGEGDLTRTLDARSRDELGNLALSFNGFVGNLAAIIGHIRAEMNALQALGRELSENMDHTSAALVRINGNLATMGSAAGKQDGAVSELGSTIEQIVGNIGSLDRLIADQIRNLGSSASAVEQMVANILSITRNIDLSMAAFAKLRDASELGYDRLAAVNETIGKIAVQSSGLEETNETITSIASQTNLLAMNAAIEAAHAGDAGRGFTVVADEIRKLSEDTAARSRDISEVLRSLGDLIKAAVHLSSDAGQSFESIRSSVQDVTARQQEIRAAVEEQSSGNRVVLDGVEQLRRIGAEVESGSREMAAGSAAILRSTQTLADVTAEVRHELDEINRGTADINSSAEQVAQLSRRTMQGIAAVETAVKRFKIE